MATVAIDLNSIQDWDTFHAEFRQKMGFPDFYGNNLYAWIDCMSDLSQPGQVGMTRIEVARGEDLFLQVADLATWQAAHPEIWAGWLQALSQINQQKSRIPGTGKILLLPC